MIRANGGSLSILRAGRCSDNDQAANGTKALLFLPHTHNAAKGLAQHLPPGAGVSYGIAISTPPANQLNGKLGKAWTSTVFKACRHSIERLEPGKGTDDSRIHT